METKLCVNGLWPIHPSAKRGDKGFARPGLYQVANDHRVKANVLRPEGIEPRVSRRNPSRHRSTDRGKVAVEELSVALV